MFTKEQIKKAKDIIVDSKYTICLTGAGISTPSGIPDFRSPKIGIWSKVDPLEVATIWAYQNNPAKFYEVMGSMLNLIFEAKPNPAHSSLAVLEEKNLLQLTITQNIDSLHQKAGSKSVVELHGNLRESICLRCRKIGKIDEIIGQLKEEKNKIPICKLCNGLLKPNVILFGESLPIDALYKSQKSAYDCEVMIIVGSSLVVYPAASLPTIAVSNGAKIIVINLQPTYIDSKSEVVICGEVDKVLPEIINAL